ncbi:MAG TPA: hypothetical protein VM925_36895 [Labilithrix sp.]|nr:hypothetical protein [Labilithrix sp.]
MSERQIELTWRCSSCTHQNLGRYMVCQSCGNPKDESEEYEMPEDPSAVASVTDEKLLRMAEAGENWACAYCASSQRALDGGCLRCGAGRAEGANVRDAALIPEPADHVVARTFRGKLGPAHYVLMALVGIAIVVVISTFGSRKVQAIQTADSPTSQPVATRMPVRTEFSAEVISASWTRSIRIEKWQLAPHEAFTTDIPEGAVEVRAAGQHLHHHEDVFDHDETEYDNVEVPDGYRTETYSDRVACGEDCTTSTRSCRQVCSGSKRTCRQVCKNNKNGFASCREECSGSGETCREQCTGGDRKCTTKYCNQTKTRQIPKTRTERRPRIVKKYRSEPRYASWSAFKTWEWVALRTAEGAGDDVSPRWPDAGTIPAIAILGDAGPKPGTQREVRTQTMHVTLRTDDGQSRPYTPSSEEEFVRLAPGRTLQVRVVNGTLTVL